MKKSINENNLQNEQDTINNKEEKRSKTMYVPDDELLEYSRNKAEGKIDADSAAKSFKMDSERKEKKFIKFDFAKIKALVLSIIPTKADNTKSIILKCVSLVLALAIIVSGIYLAVYFADLSSQNTEIDNIRNTYDSNRDDYQYNEDGQFSKFDAIKKQNNDVVGWLEIKGTEVNNPVYQTNDNDFYITHDMNKESNSYGALFLDYRCDINPVSLTQNQIIYGHNMRFGAMFGTLDEYRNIEYYKQHPIISFDSLYEKREYKIISMMISNSGTDATFKDVYGSDFSPYKASFSSQEDFMMWIAQCKARSLFDTTVDVKASDEMITLSTCCYDFDEARFVIVARLVREGEDATVDTDNAAINSDVLYPGEYYAKKKMQIPKVTPPTISVYDSIIK